MPLFGIRGVNLLQGEAFVLEPSSVHATIAANTAGVNQYKVLGERGRFQFRLSLTAAAAVAGDTLDVYLDALMDDGATWVNCVHLPQMLGDGGVKAFVATLDAANPGTVPFDVTADCAVNVTRPAVFGSDYRLRYTIAGVATQSFTFSAGIYAIGAKV